MLLSGNKGSGKTSICMKVSPTVFISTEQEIQEVGHAWYRIMGEEASVPLMSNCWSWEQLQEDLLVLQKGDRVIVDSVSQFATGPKSQEVVKAIIEHVRKTGAVAWFIAQFTKDGDMLGPNMLNHMVDVVCQIPDDNLGMRRLTASKNRFGGLFARYFALTGEGVTEQDFEYAYSVEGSAGNYSLHLFPLGGAKLNGIFTKMTEAGLLLEGLASAGIQCQGYKDGFAQPSDTEMRKQFAEEHGLTWISPTQAKENIKALLKKQGTTQEM